MDKQTLRRMVREAKKAVSADDKLLRSNAIMAQVERVPQFVEARTVLMYWAMADEVQTHDFVDRWWQRKTVLLPCVDGNDLLLRRYEGRSSLRLGDQFGIPEPVGEVFTNLEAIDLIVVPGVAFDTHNNRMGRGRGFYDRLLKTTEKAYKIGVAFNFQVFDSIPVEPFDVPMDLVITEP